MEEDHGPEGMEVVVFVTALFPLGFVCATPGALEAIENTGQSEADFIARHALGDWGDLDEEDRAANDRDLRSGGRLFSAYHLADRTKIYIITEHDRSATTILLPSEY